MRRWAPIAVATFLSLSLTESTLVAQSQVTIRAVNRVPDNNIRDLVTGGRDLTEQDIRDLIRSPFAGDTISVQAVVLSNPRNSGLSEVIAGRVARVHFFVRDLAADSMGNSGMAIQVIDRKWDEHGVLQLSVGDVVNLRAVVSEFQNGLYLDPISIDWIGDFDTFRLDPDILAANYSFDVHDLNRSFRDGTFQARWEMFPRINGSPVCFERAMVEQVKTPSPPNRVDWALTTNGASRMYTYDLSHRFRTDTRSTYPPEFNLRDDDFTPPPIGAIVSVCGFVVLQAFNDPDAVGRPLASNTGTMFSLIPIGESDLEVLELPPSIDHVSRPDLVLRSNVGFLVSASITADPTRAIESATLIHIVGNDTTTRPMVRRPLTRWVSAIPPTAQDGAFVRYRVRATDSAGLEVVSEEVQYRVLDRGINSISDIQTTYDGGRGPSPFANVTVPVNIVGFVQSNHGLSGLRSIQSGLISIQDDSLLSPWSGILLDPASAEGLGLQSGDRIHITRARIDEVDGMTVLSNVTIASRVRGDNGLGYATVSTADLQDVGVAESFESMLVQFNSAVTVERFQGGEWAIANAHLSEQVRVSNRYSDVGNDALSNWELRPFIRGLWIESGSEWMLALQTEDDLGAVVNVAVEPDEVVRKSGGLDQNFPNPAAFSTNVTFQTFELSEVLLEVFDIRGRRVELVVNDFLQPGSYSRILDVSNLVTGTYMLRLTQASGSIFRKMTVSR